ncbi:hypothetical protein O6H91_11G060100 [Diphasiastrum complanatum]|uniref:Uncharacterized protein n=1 Tax=Diphasiastrum complanatum TaxID=34168 RepID=A0ACC2C9M8_DIPCM|nr:hypothetical protein O6H91_11G060100 [Diphasiastrum complanatum]
MLPQAVRLHSFWTPFYTPISLTARCLPLLPSPSSIKATMHSQDDSSDPKTDVKTTPQKVLFVGLGNPGSKYQGTRHNVGFEMIDTIAKAEGISINTIQCKALLGKGKIGDTVVLLAKPQTYVNLSGESVGPLAKYYKIPVEHVLVMYDDLDLEVAMMRLLPKGGHGGHNGMRNIIQNFKGNRQFPRLRIGIGRPPGTMDPKAYVLQRFSTREREEISSCW